MGKNKKSVYTVHDDFHDVILNVDSLEEVEFVEWLNEVYKQIPNCIVYFKYQPEPFPLTDKHTYVNVDKKKAQTLFQPHLYTADFHIQFNKEYINYLKRGFRLSYDFNIRDEYIDIYCDIKGTFNKYGGDRIFPIHQKLVYEKYGVYVEKIIPKEFFLEMGVPPKLAVSQKTNKPSKKYYGYQFVSTKLNNM